MKRAALAIAGVALSTMTFGGARAEEPPFRANGVSFSVGFSTVESDSGGTLQIGTSTFYDGRIAARLSVLNAGRMAVPSGESEFQRLNYDVVRLTLVNHFIQNEHLRAYTEIGPVLTVPDKKLSDNVKWNATVLFGAEIFPSTQAFPAFFIEVGDLFFRPRADKLAGKPYFATGFTFAGGLRIYF